jgi:SAM-dependent methyltransferase
MVDVKDAVRKKYGEAARRARSGTSSCCGPVGCCGPDPISADLYGREELAAVPAGAANASLGCGNPTALAELRPGEVVLDLGSGGGIDVLLSARRVGPAGKAYGLDMTDEMLALARENQAKAGVSNVEFLKGEIERIPLPDASVDVIISNCVINLSADKQQALGEAFRVLKPGGRFAVTDVVVRGDVSEAIRKSLELWVGCVAGAMEEREYADRLTRAGFADVAVEPWRIYRTEEARAFIEDAGLDYGAVAAQTDGRFMSAFVRAVKPATWTA